MQMGFSYDIAWTRKRVIGQTWTFVGEHCATTLSSKLWKLAISSFDVAVGSGRSRPAENAALAIANLCEAMMTRVC